MRVAGDGTLGQYDSAFEIAHRIASVEFRKHFLTRRVVRRQPEHGFIEGNRLFALEIRKVLVGELSRELQR